jgi:hypothetical protein
VLARTSSNLAVSQSESAANSDGHENLRRSRGRRVTWWKVGVPALSQQPGAAGSICKYVSASCAIDVGISVS